MEKKLLAVAVAGLLAAPVIAAAQSTVQIYGRVTYEWGRADQGPGRPDLDFADTPGGSAIGFKGVEQLGGGLSAWFQCESSADITGFDTSSICTRNSAVGFPGGVGDTTGAGDLFAAGYLFGHVRGRSLEECLWLGAICAAEVISH